MDHQMHHKAALVVLPFKHIGSDQEQAVFCDGITEEIILALAKIEQLRVISSTSSFYFKERQFTLREIAQQLAVTTVLEGSVRFAGELVRISAQLIQAADDTLLWSATWDRKLEHVLAVQDEVSLLIADQLREHFGHLDIADRIAEPPTADFGAYTHYRKGKQLFNKWNPADVQLAIGQYEAALQLDPQLIDAHVGLGDGYSFLAVAGFAPREEAWKKAIAHLDTATAIDPEHAGLNFMLANQAFFTKADFAGAIQYAMRSIASKPSYSDAHHFMAFLYALKGDLKRAETHIRYAKSIDPLNQETLFFEAFFYYQARVYTKAKVILEGLLDTNPHSLPAIVLLAYLLLKTRAFAAFQSLLDGVPEELIMPDERLGFQCLYLYLTRAGQEKEALVQQLIENAQADTSFQAHAYLFLYYSVCGDFDSAFALLDKCLNHQSSILLLAFSNPLAEAIQKDPRYKLYQEKLYRIKAEKPKSRRTNSAAMEEAAASAYQEKLDAFVRREAPYLNPALTLRSLAAQIDLHPNQLSWLLNERIGENFNEYINQFRIAHFKQLVIDPKNAHISLIGLAYESGFNSKTVFNTTFKKMTGLTPGAYQKQHTK